MKFLKTYDERCIGCDTCMTVCSKLFFKEDNPEKSCVEVFAHGQETFKLTVCNQCGTCVESCPVEALSINKLGVVVLNKKTCTSCYACVDACPTDNFHKPGNDGVPFKCIACGACARECPADALEIMKQ